MHTPGDERIPFDASPAMRDALDRIGRTEDIQFSPDNRRLALVTFYRNTLAIVDVEITTDGDRPHVAVTGLVEVPSTGLKNPHGVVFLDDQTLLAGSRGGAIVGFELPPRDDTNGRAEITVIDAPAKHTFEHLNAPGSLAIAGNTDGEFEMFVCNNYGDTITQHTVRTNPLAVTRNDVMIRRWLDLPDGVAVSPDGRWIAISNHNSHSVMIYERTASLSEGSDPNCVLRGTSYPHGLRFSPDGRHLFVADAGKPFIQIYASDEGGWQGVHFPASSLRVMSDDEYRALPPHGKGEGGPKGIDIDSTGRVLAVTSEFERLAFFDVAAIVKRSVPHARDHAEQVRDELELQQHFREAEAYIAALEASNSFRLTKPLREFKLRFKKQT